VERPREGHALVGTQFLVRGSWWKGATQQERQTLYSVKCVAFDAEHPFVTYKRKPDLTRVRTVTAAPAIRFVLTRKQDHAWNGDNLWMTLTQYAECCVQYDEGLLAPDPEADQPPRKKVRHDSPPLPLRDPSAASVIASSPATTQPPSAAAATAVSAAAAGGEKQRFQVLAMPDSYQRCAYCSDQHRGRISCWRTCGSKKMRRKLALAAKAAGTAAAPARAVGPGGDQAVSAESAPAPKAAKEREWAPPPPRNKKAQEAYAMAKQLLKTPCAFRGKLLTAGSRVKWLTVFANALDHDHARLARHLVILEQNLPWSAVTEDFGSNRPQFVRQVKAVKGPLEARLVLDSLARFIRDHDDHRSGGYSVPGGAAGVLLASLAVSGDKHNHAGALPHLPVKAGAHAMEGGAAAGERVKKSHKKIVLGKPLRSGGRPSMHEGET
jgi:hypothetical protein